MAYTEALASDMKTPTELGCDECGLVCRVQIASHIVPDGLNAVREEAKRALREAGCTHVG